MAISLVPEDLVARLLYRDASVLILDKPAGIAVHKGRGAGPNLEALLPALAFGLPRPPALAHRLDKDTSGCLVLGRHRQALARLGLLFREGRVGKTYWAIVAGGPKADAGEIAHPLARRSHDRRSWVMKVSADGDPALTQYRVLARGDGASLLELQPRTGRTHQLRVHCAAEGMPIAGDRLYGGDLAMAASAQLMLHARSVSLPFYPNKTDIEALAAVPPPFAAGMALYGFGGEHAS